MATAIDIRAAIDECAQAATKAEPLNTDARLQSFIARLSGAMIGLNEQGLHDTLWKLFETATPSRPSLITEGG